MNINNKVVLVTGGGSGLGEATAQVFSKLGATVAVLDRSFEAAERVVEGLAGDGLAIDVDVTDEGSVEQAMKEIDSKFGEVSVCVNAAGIAPAAKIVSRGVAMDLSDFRTAIDVNLIGLFDVTRLCAERMIRNEPDEHGERGVIVNVSSGAAWQGGKGQAAYSASKAGVIGMMLPVARDLAPHGIRVVSIAPGVFDTQMSAGFNSEVREQLISAVLNPARFGRPEEFANLVCHVVNNAYLNATVLSVDGGVRS